MVVALLTACLALSLTALAACCCAVVAALLAADAATSRIALRYPDRAEVSA